MRIIRRVHWSESFKKKRTEVKQEGELQVCSVVLVLCVESVSVHRSAALVWLQHVFDLLGGSLVVQMFGRIPVRQ